MGNGVGLGKCGNIFPIDQENSDKTRCSIMIEKSLTSNSYHLPWLTPGTDGIEVGYIPTQSDSVDNGFHISFKSEHAPELKFTARGYRTGAFQNHFRRVSNHYLQRRVNKSIALHCSVTQFILK